MAAANKHNVRFNVDDDDNVEDDVRHDDGLQDGGNGQQQMPQFAIHEGVDQATANLLTMQMNMKQNMMAQMEQNYQQNQFQLEKRLDIERQEQHELAKQLKNCDNNGPKVVGKAPMFKLEKDREKFKTWKLKWNNILISSNINLINRAAVKEEQTKAALTAALSDDTLKWLNGQDLDELRKAKFIIQKIEEYIQGTTNPYVQVVELIGRKKSSKESFIHFVTDVCERVKGCRLTR
jgi:hypothetical protein